MKKNLVSIIILALLIVNLFLTCFMMFSFTGAAQKTWMVVSDIAYAMDMAKGGTPATEAAEAEDVPVTDQVPYNITEPMTIPLKAEPPAADGTTSPTSYIIIQASLQLNSKHEDYKDFGEGDLTQYVAIIQDEIISVFGRYTKSDVLSEERDTLTQIKSEIVAQLRDRLNSEIVYDISFRDIKYS